MNAMKFYKYSSRLWNTTFMASLTLEDMNDINGEPPHNLLIKGELDHFDYPIVFEQFDGKKTRDMLDTGWPSLYLISDAMANAFQEEGFTGWKSYPVRVYDKKGNEINGYHGFSIVGSSGPRIFDENSVIEKQFVENGPLVKYYKGYSFDENEWDGSDFFLPKNLLGIYVTENVYKLVKRCKFSNVRFFDISEHEIDRDIVLMHQRKNHNQ